MFLKFRKEKAKMKFLIQRVKQAKVTVEEKVTGEIRKGFLVLVGVGPNDTEEIADYLVQKLIKLRVFEDENGKMNLSLKDIQGSLLMVSQFTLYADCSGGNRPSFIGAAKPEKAKALYEYCMQECKKQGITVEHGIFGADMQVELINDGPVTILLEKEV